MHKQRFKLGLQSLVESRADYFYDFNNDKGFLIQNILPSNIYLSLPPFLTNSQFTKSHAELTVRIARSRIHVERATQRLKRYEVLNGP